MCEIVILVVTDAEKKYLSFPALKPQRKTVVFIHV